MKESPEKWTKQLVQEHAQVAVQIELYTLPFYITAMTSIKDTSCDAYKCIGSVIMEEMLHMQLASNLCLALDTKPDFSPPQYGKDIPYLDPECHDLNASLGPLNQETIETMLLIEIPEDSEGNKSDHTTPQYPYSSIAEMYDALREGIRQVGEDAFNWGVEHQQKRFGQQQFRQIITKYSDAINAIDTIVNQGEGHPARGTVQVKNCDLCG
ncbi:MAG: ferritin-like domain-containing protein [Candidatus Electrothrix communis]|nr:MAG: ferritin-like domain-containing protein [Candidatus Electrothrix communis]